MNTRYYQTGKDHSSSKYQRKGISLVLSLLSVPSKVFFRVVIDRIRDAIEDKLRPKQAAYRRGRGTLEHVYILRNILEQSIERQAPLHISFKHFEEALDSIIRDEL